MRLYLTLVCAVLLAGCTRDQEQTDHAILMFLNIEETAAAQLDETPPPIQMTANAIREAAAAGAKVLGHVRD